MKSITKFALWAVLAVPTLTLSAASQNPIPNESSAQPQLYYAVYVPAENAAELTQIDWDDHRGCDGDHDRDDHGCYWRDRDGDRYHYRGNGYVGNGYYYGPGYSTYYGPSGWYDKHGRWHTAYGWYDKHGKWHRDRDHDEH